MLAYPIMTLNKFKNKGEVIKTHGLWMGKTGWCRDVNRLIIKLMYLVVFSINLYVVNVGLILC